MISVEKPGSPAEILEHHGIKGMRWGVRSSRTSASSPKSSAEKSAQTAHRKQVAKKVAIGVGVTVAVVGTAYVAYRLNKSGKLPISSLHNRGKGGGKVYKPIDDIPKVKVSAIAQAQRSIDREHFIKLMMSSKKYAPTLAEATRIANETYSPL